MPILKNAKKALRASKRKAQYNQIARSRAKTAMAAVKKSPTMALLAAAYSAIDKGVKRNVFHRNKAARLKAQLAKLVKPTKLAKVAKTVKSAAKKTLKKAVKASPKKKAVKK